jgi:hypothetical protein
MGKKVPHRTVDVDDDNEPVRPPEEEKGVTFPDDVLESVCGKLGITEGQLSDLMEGNPETTEEIMKAILRHLEWSLKPLTPDRVNRVILGVLDPVEKKWLAKQVDY